MNWILPILVFKAGLLVNPQPYLGTADVQPMSYLVSEDLVPYTTITAGVAFFDKALNAEVDLTGYYGMTGHKGYLATPVDPVTGLPLPSFWTFSQSPPLAVTARTHIYLDIGPVVAGWKYRITNDPAMPYHIGESYGAIHEAYIQVDVGEILTGKD